MIRLGPLLLVFAVIGCSGGGMNDSSLSTAAGPSTGTEAPLVGTTSIGAPPAGHDPATVVTEYLPGVEARLHLPEGGGQAPIVVMIPGGAWQTADPSGFEGLARHLAASGIAAAPVEVRAAEDGVVFPVPVEDVLCALATAVEAAAGEGLSPGPLVVLGHSSGAHLAALAALEPETYMSGCPSPAVVPEALIGMSGTYDVRDLPEFAIALFGVDQDQDPEAWTSGNPILIAASRPELPVLLIHGEADNLVPIAFTSEFAAALEAGGHETRVEVVAGADHHTIYTADGSGDLLLDWLGGLG